MGERSGGSAKVDAYASTRGLPGRRVIRPRVDELVDGLAFDLLQAARERIEAEGVFHLALSGGSTPAALYQRLMIDPRFRAFPWAWTHLWQVDERCVPPDDQRSNYRMLRELLIDHADLPAECVHPMPAEREDGDRRYEQDLRAALEGSEHEGRLDFVLLGMGGDGHTASLFPHTPALRERDRWVVFNDGDAMAEPKPRMTMTYPLLNAARRIAVLVTGENKHAALQHVSVAGRDPQRLPVTGVEPIHTDTELTWHLDHAAALGPGA